MATFPATPAPSYGAEKRSSPSIRSVKFGDGYEQRLTFGLNQNPKSWSLSWANITEADADTLEAFLDARAADAASFTWTPPDTSTAYKWICREWSKSIPYTGRANLSATFEQVFEP
jgi:phage-related protein